MISEVLLTDDYFTAMQNPQENMMKILSLTNMIGKKRDKAVKNLNGLRDFYDGH